MHDKKIYMYAKYSGKEFVSDYWKSRIGFVPGGKAPNIKETITILKQEKSRDKERDNCINTEQIVTKVFNTICEKEEAKAKFYLDKLIQRYEIRRMLFSHYSLNWRKAIGNEIYLTNYLKFSISLGLMYKKTKVLQYLSTWLKVNDMLIALNTLNKNESKVATLVQSIIELEGIEVKDLLNKTGVLKD